jgi:hypothetical protein
MGGAMVGIDEDASAPYYNPAAFERAGHTEVDLSATALTVHSLTFAPYLGDSATERSVGILPNASVGSRPFHGGRLSLCIFTTQDDDLVLDRSFTPPTSTGLATAQIHSDSSESTYLLGPSLGMPLSDVLSVGISGFFVYRSVGLHERVFQMASSTNAAVQSFERIEDTEQLSQGLIIVGGVQVRPGGGEGRWVLGVSVRSGSSLADSGQHQVVEYVQQRQSDGTTQYVRTPLENSTQGQSEIPSQIALGSSVRLGRGRFSADVTIDSAQSYINLGATVDRKLTVNGTFGGEWSLDPAWMVRAGLFTNRSSAPSVPDDNQPSSPHVDEYGLTLGFTQVGVRHRADFALEFAEDYGQAKIEGIDGVLQRVNVQGFEVSFVIGGAYRL